MMFPHHQIDHPALRGTTPARFSVPFRRLALPCSKGFTLVELVTVIVLTGILAAFAVPRFFERGTFDSRAFSDQTRAMLRYAQKLAIAQQRQVYMRLDGNSIALCFDSACATLVPSPAGGNSGSTATVANCGATAAARLWFCEGVPTGLAYTRAPTSQSIFYFDPAGQPFAAADTSMAISTFQRLTITIAGANAANSVIIVEPETGYVH